jgi:pyruvate/2-oxoglutarate dehydrogenase complex dihydrolipoamide acyltransferase (E2) component
MSESRGFRAEPFDADRRMVAASAAISKAKHVIHLVIEADIGEARSLIATHRVQAGERLSLTAYVATCLARTLAEFPQFNSFRRGNRLIVLDDVTISVLFEREIGGKSVPEPVGIHEATRKTYREINDELRAAQQHEGQRLGAATGMGWIRFIPGFLLRIFVRLAARSISMQKKYGVVGVTAVGMFGSGPLWLVPLTNATVTVGIGSIIKRPVVVDGELWEREFLCLTVSFDHDIVDGAPAARFVGRFTELLASGDEVRGLVAAA